MTSETRARFLALFGLVGGIFGITLLLYAIVETARGLVPDGRFTVGHVLLGFGAIFLAVGGVAYAWNRIVDGRRIARLGRGEGLVARWRVSPETWAAFARIDERLNRQPDPGPNHVSTRGAPPATGVEVVVGRDVIGVNGRYHPMAKRGGHTLRAVLERAGPPSFLELQCSYSAPHRTTRWVVRFPFEPASARDAARVAAHFRSANR